MKLSDIFFAVLYGSAFILIIYFIVGLVYRPGPSTVVIYDEIPVYQQQSVIWPWYSPYNWYNTWSPWSYTGSGYYGHGMHHWNRPWGRGHGGRGGRGGHGGHGGR